MGKKELILNLMKRTVKCYLIFVRAYSCQWRGRARTQKAAAEARTAAGLSGPPVLPATPTPDPEWNLRGGSRIVRGGSRGGGDR